VQPAISRAKWRLEKRGRLCSPELDVFMATPLVNAAHTYLASKSDREQRRLVGSRRMSTRRNQRGRRLKSNRRWQPWEIDVLGKVPDRKAVRKTGRTLSAVSTKRVELKIPAIRTRRLPWTPKQIALLGKLPDREAARLIGCYYSNAARKRLELGIPYTAQKMKYWTTREDRLVGTMPDADLARRLKRSRQAVLGRRLKLGIPVAPNPKFRLWTKKSGCLGNIQTRKFTAVEPNASICGDEAAQAEDFHAVGQRREF
jgi:hypothetical protein